MAFRSSYVPRHPSLPGLNSRLRTVNSARANLPSSLHARVENRFPCPFPWSEPAARVDRTLHAVVKRCTTEPLWPWGIPRVYYGDTDHGLNCLVQWNCCPCHSAGPGRVLPAPVLGSSDPRDLSLQGSRPGKIVSHSSGPVKEPQTMLVHACQWTPTWPCHCVCSGSARTNDL